MTQYSVSLLRLSRALLVPICQFGGWGWDGIIIMWPLKFLFDISPHRNSRNQKRNLKTEECLFRRQMRHHACLDNKTNVAVARIDRPLKWKFTALNGIVGISKYDISPQCSCAGGPLHRSVRGRLLQGFQQSASAGENFLWRARQTSLTQLTEQADGLVGWHLPPSWSRRKISTTCLMSHQVSDSSI